MARSVLHPPVDERFLALRDQSKGTGSAKLKYLVTMLKVLLFLVADPCPQCLIAVDHAFSKSGLS